MSANHIRLRPLRQDDTALLYKWISNRDLLIQNAAYYPVSERAHLEWVAEIMKNSSTRAFFIIEDVSTAHVIGSCQLLNIDGVHHSAELQIRIGNTESQGKGFGSEAVMSLLRFGFLDLNLHRIYLHVFASNERAIGAYRKCGFIQEGILREAAFINGRWQDVIIMGMLVTDYE